MREEKPSFEQAMNASLLWCNAWDNEELSDEVLADRVAELIKTPEGARGFLVISLSSNGPLMDRLPEPLVLELRAAGELIIELSIKNLAMSSAMAIHHHRNQDIDQQERSERITTRCRELLRLLEPNGVKSKLEMLLNALEGEGDDVNFVNRWGYDNEQKIAIATSLNSVPES